MTDLLIPSDSPTMMVLEELSVIEQRDVGHVVACAVGLYRDWAKWRQDGESLCVMDSKKRIRKVEPF